MSSFAPPARQIVMSVPFPNPETSWHVEQGNQPIDIQAVSHRIGRDNVRVVRLSGGLANDNLLIDGQRVLRIYKRDVSSLGREYELLARKWSHFRVPRVLRRGDDFLILEYYQLRPLENTMQSGEATGLALAEIHQAEFDTCGLFGIGIAVTEPWPDFAHAIETYIQSSQGRSTRYKELLSQVAEFVTLRKQEMSAACERAVLLHGDFKASNLHTTQDGELLVLDWEFTYAGPASMDIGQLFRWGQPEPFAEGVVDGYKAGGGKLAAN